MKNIQDIAFHPGSKEELLPGFAKEFPYIASRVEISQYTGRFVPWHWHRAVELFYIESGALVYRTPGGEALFPAGSGGLVNANVLHMTREGTRTGKNIQLLHIFHVSLLAGEQGSRIEQRYIHPIITAPQIELIPLFPGNTGQEKILRMIRESFLLSDDACGYEIRLRAALSEIWLQLLEEARPALSKHVNYNKSNDRIKSMLVYIHEHYQEKISIRELAAAVCLSERECFRIFQNCLHMTPAEYIKSCRLQAACQMLAQGEESVTVIGHACGLGNSSYFGKVFREALHCTPTQYREKWQDRDR